ncbi:Mu transposase C-terminal domain-containing protein [Streptomyces sp. NPDC054802]
MRWQAITASGIRIRHRTYDADLLAPYRGQPSPVAGRGGKWEIHTNPHDARQIWVRLPEGELTEIPWIHRAHVHQPFNDHTWQHIRTLTLYGNHGDAEQYEADLADALDQLMRRVHTGHATKTEQALLARTAHVPLPTARHADHHTEAPADSPAQQDDDSIDDLDDDFSPTPATGFGLYDAYEEACKW